MIVKTVVERNERHTHKSRVGFPHGSKYASALESASVDDLAVLYTVEFDTQGLDALGIQLTSGESKVGKLDMSLAVY